MHLELRRLLEAVHFVATKPHATRQFVCSKQWQRLNWPFARPAASHQAYLELE